MPKRLIEFMALPASHAPGFMSSELSFETYVLEYYRYHPD